MSDEELAEIRARADAATPGPWQTIQPGGPNGPFWAICNPQGNIIALRLSQSPQDAAFIAFARDDIPALLDEIERLRAEPVALDSSVVTLFGQPLDYWRELHQRVQNRGLTDIVSDCARLRIENEWLQAYADKLADALPEGGLPHDIETRRAANVALAQENHELRAEVARLREALYRIESAHLNPDLLPHQFSERVAKIVKAALVETAA